MDILLHIILCGIVIFTVCSFFCCYKMTKAKQDDYLKMYWCRHGFRLVIIVEALRLCELVIKHG